jgi:RIO kinase 1
MKKKQNFTLYEQLEDLAEIPPIRNVPDDQLRYRSPSQEKKKHSTPNEISELAEQENELDFSYGASKHEKAWLISSLKDFYRQQWFDDVLRLIKGGGKEASVYQCLANQTTQSKYLAAKVYRPRKFRQLRNDSFYREGRQHLDDEGHEIRDGGALHAIQKRTNLGMRLLHTSWIEHEFQTMALLYKAGADIPEPYVSGNNAILMAYIGWDDVPAPTLNSVKLTPSEARLVFDKVLHNVEIMLENNRVHADLSAYNILYFEGEIFIIDFPQAIDPLVNRNAFTVFQRDLTRLCEYFHAQGLPCDPNKTSEDLWQKHGFKINQPGDPGLFTPEDLEKYEE